MAYNLFSSVITGLTTPHLGKTEGFSVLPSMPTLCEYSSCQVNVFFCQHTHHPFSVNATGDSKADSCS